MNIPELLEHIAVGESTKQQFKENIFSPESMAAEMVAMSNSEGGMVFIGINDSDWNVTGLSKDDVQRINQLISNASSQLVRPPINPYTEILHHPNGLVLVVHIQKGVSKPYMDNNAVVWVKSGSDKRKVTSREEIQRMFQSASLIHGDEIPVNNLTVSEIDYPYFVEFVQKMFGDLFTVSQEELPRVLENMNLAKNETLNVAGALLFVAIPQFKLPSFLIKAVAFPGSRVDIESYVDSRDMRGNIDRMFRESIAFLLGNIRHIQKDQSVNSIGQPEIPQIVFEELVANALIHRDYFISAPIRIFVFSDRIEIISPGHLPNNLSIENIKSGNSNFRNPILSSFATRIIPYRGIGSGVQRALQAYPHIDFIDDRQANQFTVIIKRIHNQ